MNGRNTDGFGGLVVPLPLAEERQDQPVE